MSIHFFAFSSAFSIFGRAFFVRGIFFDVHDPPPRRRRKVRKYNDNFFVVIPLLRLTEEAKRCQRNQRILWSFDDSDDSYDVSIGFRCETS